MLYLVLQLITAGFGQAADPTLVYSNGRIVASPPNGLKVLGQNIEILDKVACSGKIDSPAALSVPSECDYLHGLYRFIYTVPSSSKKEQFLVDFSISKNKKGHTFLVGDGITIKEEVF